MLTNIYPSGSGISYHSPKPMNEGQTPSDECDYLDGKPCYCDGPMALSDEWVTILIHEGDKPVWKLLDDFYTSTFGTEYSDVPLAYGID